MIITKKEDKIFVDISLAFEPNPVNGDISVLRDERAINASIKNIVMTMPREASFLPDFGSVINDMLFEVADAGTALMIEEEIKRAIGYNEPRVDNVDVKVKGMIDRNELVATIKYDIIGLERNVEFSVILTPTG